MNDIIADEMVEAIMRDLSDRSGFDLSNIDDEILTEMKNKWSKIIMDIWMDHT